MIPMTPADISETVVHVDTVVYNADLPRRVDISETVVHGSDMTVKSAVKSAVETTTVEAATVPSARVGKIWLAEDNRAQHRSCNAHDGACLPRSGFVIP
jgi:uncharacterized protein YqgV (UPF0045/DUF77 family)